MWLQLCYRGQRSFLFNCLNHGAGIFRAFSNVYMHNYLFQISLLSKTLPPPFPPSWIYHLFFPGKPFFSIWTAWVQLKCNAKQINRIAVRPSRETILAVSVHTESRIEVTQIKCNGVKYIAQGTVTRNYWLTFFPLLTTFQYSFCDWYTVLVN